jgi:preprotein translocase subunit SecD
MEDEEILDSRDMVSAKVEYNERQKLYMVQVTLTEAGKDMITRVTTEEYTQGGTMAVWLDDRMICNPVITAPITNGEVAFYTTAGGARVLASVINSGPMPVALKAETGQFLMPDIVADEG